MRIVVPFTKEPAIDDGLNPDCRYVGHSDYEYWYLIVDLWKRGEPFILVEHDLKPTKEQIEELANCPEDLCAFEYAYDDGKIWSLGCTKFGPKCLAFTITCEIRYSVLNYGPPAPHWKDVCTHLLSQLINSGITAHVHKGLVEHVNH